MLYNTRLVRLMNKFCKCQQFCK